MHIIAELGKRRRLSLRELKPQRNNMNTKVSRREKPLESILS